MGSEMCIRDSTAGTAAPSTTSVPTPSPTSVPRTRGSTSSASSLLKKQRRLILDLQHKQKQLFIQYTELHQQCHKLNETITEVKDNRHKDFLIGIVANLGINALLSGIVTLVCLCVNKFKKRQTSGRRDDQTVAVVAEEVPLRPASPARPSQPEVVRRQPRENPFYRAGPTAPALPDRVYRVRR